MRCCGTEVRSACSPNKVGSSWSHPWRGAGEAVQCGGRLHGEERRKESPCYLQEGCNQCNYFVYF